MKTENFLKLIQTITGRDFLINTENKTIDLDTVYFIYKILPISKMEVSFKFKTPKNEEKLISSFLTAFYNKYFEPNPKAYNKIYGGIEYKWAEKTAEQKEFAYLNHRSNMFYKNELKDQVLKNINKTGVSNILCKYGLYTTNYGIGLFVLFGGAQELEAINILSKYLNKNNIIFTNEFSNARWVYRFKINIDKDTHISILSDFENTL